MSTLLREQIGLQPALWKAVQKKAKAAGSSVRDYVRFMIERDLLADQPFEEIVRPIQEDVAKSGMREEELREIVNEARHAKRGRKARR